MNTTEINLRACEILGVDPNKVSKLSVVFAADDFPTAHIEMAIHEDCGEFFSLLAMDGVVEKIKKVNDDGAGKEAS